MHTSRLTSTLSRASRRDPVARLVLTTAGSSCGVIPTAIASANSTESITGRRSSRLVTKISTRQGDRHPQQQVGESAQTGLELGLGLPLTQAGGDAAELGVARRSRTPPRSPRPALTMVPMNARSVESARPASALTGCGDFSEAADSPDRMLSLHSRPLTSISRTSAGTASPSASRITSPGTRSLTSTLMNCPSRRTTALWCTAECSAAEARSARYSLTKPKPMLAARMTPMMIACVLSPRKNETHRGSRQQPEHGAAQLAPQHRDRADPMSANGIRAVPQQSRRRLRAGQSLGRTLEPSQHLIEWG